MKKKEIIKEATTKYHPEKIESYWQERWKQEKTYHPDLESAKKPYFALMMFPYPSAEGMHVGNMYAFTGSDIHGRFKRQQGYDVLEPIGLDGFGIHSENYALKIGKHPMDQAAIAEKNFYRQLQAIGNSFDWERTVETYSPNYYKWTQWLFTELFKAGLAYRKKAPVNFCPSCKTVLADEQVIDSKCERCSSVVEKKDLEQWFFRITSYSEQLLKNIPELDWSEKVKIAQKKWIGKKQGINITYKFEEGDGEIVCFTTRPDTNFGATFIVLGPEYPSLEKIVTKEYKKEVNEYIKRSLSRSDSERMEEKRKKTGVFTGRYVINQLNGARLPVWVSDFVIGNVGTGAVVGVPGHDTRDFEFATEFGLPIIRVVIGKDNDRSPITLHEQVQESEGKMINSAFLDGMEIHDAIPKIMDHIEEKGFGERIISYHLRDWLISRQRYWGAPIPMIYCATCAKKGESWFTTVEAKKYRESNIKSQALRAQHIGISVTEAAGWYPVVEKDLPVLLPHIDDYKPLGTGTSPLGAHKEFYETVCPQCGMFAERETDVADTFLDSSWYFLRYTATDLDDKAFDTERVKRWLPVNMYIGGAEHSVLHLLYSRFVTMVLNDLGMIDFDEPFAKFYAHGLLIKEGAKMSKSKGNVIIPDEYIQKYGSDTLRTYLMFLGPFNMGGDFYDSGIEGIYKFLKRVWHAFTTTPISSEAGTAEEVGRRHGVVKGVTEDLEALRYNTAIAKLMTYYNALSKQTVLAQVDVATFLQLLAPFAPHMTEELWQKLSLGKKDPSDKFQSIHTALWPQYDEKLLAQKAHVIAIQVNGKLRASMPIAEEDLFNEKEVSKQAQLIENVQNHLTGQKIKKTIYVPGKIINFVI